MSELYVSARLSSSAFAFIVLFMGLLSHSRPAVQLLCFFMELFGLSRPAKHLLCAPASFQLLKLVLGLEKGVVEIQAPGNRIEK